MPRSPLKANSCRALTLLLAFAVFASLILIEAGAQGRRSQLQSNNAAGSNAQQARRKSIASVQNVDTREGSRVTITADVPLNDYEAYMAGDRFYVVIPNAELSYQNVQTLPTTLRGQGFQDVRVERKGNDLVFSFRMLAGMRARPEQRFNRLDIIFTAPPGVVFNVPNTNGGGRPNRNGTGGGGGRTGTGNYSGNTNTGGGGGGGRSTTGGGTRTNGGGGTSTTNTGGGGGGGGTSTATSGGGGGGTTGGGTTGGRGGRSGGRRGGSGGYSGGGGDRGGGGAPLNIPLPSEIQANTSPNPTTGASPSTGASPLASPGTGAGTAQTVPTPPATSSPTPPGNEIAQNQPQSPVTAPPATSTTTTSAPAPAPASNTGFAAAIRENWLPLLIGLLVLAAIVLLIASRSRADRADERETRRLETKKQEPIKDKPVTSSRTGATLAGGAAAAGSTAVAAMAKEPSARATAPAKEPEKTEEVREIEPVAPAVGMEQIGTEVKNLLDGKDYDEAVIASNNADTRQIVSTELLAALASRNPERRLRAREAFTRHGFFDEATQKLRTSTTPAERISAARALGLTQDQAATPHLVAALEDDDPEVRRASVNALAELRDPSAIGPLNALLEREKNRKVPHSLIRRAIEASATIDLPETPTAATSATPATPPTAPDADKKDKDDDDREVFEI